MVPVPFNGSIATDGATITAPYLDRGTINANRYDGRIIKVAEDAAAVDYAPAVTLGAAITDTTGTTVTVSSSTDIRVGHIIEVTAAEKMLVRAIVSGTSITVTRGYQGTTAQTHLNAATVKYDPFGFTTGVDNGGFAAGGVITISPNFASVTGTEIGSLYGAGSFIMYPKGIVPEYIIARMNAVLRNTSRPHLWFPSLVPDSDMSSADLANWPLVSSGTRVFTTTAASILYGERALAITAAASIGSGAESLAWPVTEGEQMIVLVPIKNNPVADATAGTIAKVVLRRVTTTAADIKSVTNLNERLYTDVFFRETIPDGCQMVNLQFLSAAASALFIISPHVVVQSDRRRWYSVPSWWTRESQLKELVVWQPDYSSDEPDSYISLSQGQYAVKNADFLRSDIDITPMRIGFANQGSYPVGCIVQRPFAELGGDSTTTVADKDYVAFKTVSNILRDRQDQAWKHWAARASVRAKMFKYGGREIDMRENLTYAESY